MDSYSLKKEYQNKKVAVAIGDRSFGIDKDFHTTYANADAFIDKNKEILSKYFDLVKPQTEAKNKSAKK